MVKKNPFIKVILVLLFIILYINSYSQNCSVTGKIFDNNTKEPIQYASVILTSQNDTSIFLGAISDENGKFLINNIKEGYYNLKLSFIGYQTIVMENILMQRGERNIGEIYMNILIENLNSISVRAIKPAIIYKVDKKVIDAGSFPTAEVAMDLLENVPSLQVDFEGRLTYRGDGTFIVFINGHPTANGEEKLRQIPADRIDKIEIITNPSAKYHAEGTAGIIQVILKRNRLQGYAINTNIKMSTLKSYSWNFSVDKNDETDGWYFEGQFSFFFFNVLTNDEVQKIYDANKLYFIESKYGRKKRNFQNYLEFGFNYDLTDKDYVDFSIYVNPLKCNEQRYISGSTSESLYQNNKLISKEFYYLNSTSDVTYRYLGTTFTYKHAFNKERTSLISSYIDFSTYLHPLINKKTDIKEYQDFTERIGSIGNEQNEIILDFDFSYSNKFKKKTSIESGFNINLDHIPNITNANGKFDEQGNFTQFSFEPKNQQVDFKEDIYAAYINLKSGWKRLDFQFGLRAEFTDRKSNYIYEKSNGTRTGTPSFNQFIDYFPSAHFLYNISKTHQIGINYSYRIQRPEYWRLIPLKQYFSPYQYGIGNGNLLPAYSNSFELVYKKSWDKDFIGFELFSRNTTNVIQTYYRTDTANIIISTHENVGDSWSIGAEIMAGVDIFKWWDLNVSSSIYNYTLNINIEKPERTEKQLYNKSRINNSFLLPKNFTFKWDFNYNSPSISAQYRTEGYFSSNIAVQKSIKENTWRFTLSYANVFNTLNYNIEKTGFDFNIYNHIIRQPYASFKITYNFDNQK